MQKIRIGITLGDINGIGPEVIIKSVYPPGILEMCTPVIYGSAKAVSYHKNIVQYDDFAFQSLQSAERLNHRKVNIINCWDETVNINLGRATEEGGKYAYIALDRAVRDLRDGLIDALVTGPVNKHAMRLVDFPAMGHTDYLEQQFDGEALMIMVSDALRVGLVTDHIALREVADKISREAVRHKLQLFIRSLQSDFGIERPSIAVLGLNPHASDQGIMGDEEEEIIRPVIIEEKKNGNLVMGPYPADGFFGAAMYRKVDAVLAMYHDQGLIPFKAVSFGFGVNVTAGLGVVRTSPDHGTAYDLAGKNEADPSSMRNAIYTAIDIFRSRQANREMHHKPVKKAPKPPDLLETDTVPEVFTDGDGESIH